MDKETLIALRYVLADLYPTVRDSRVVVSDAGIPPAYVEFSDKAITNWFEILRQAEIRGKTLEIVRIALEMATDNSILKEISLKGKLTPAPAPVIDKDISWHGDTSAENLEKLMENKSTLLPISFLEVGLLRSKSVARVRLENGELGTGFLVKDNVLVTNNHVFPNAESAKTAIIQFNYQNNASGLDLEPINFSLDPDNGFQTSEADDWTLVRVKGEANQDWGKILMEKIEDYKEVRYVNIIQHPSGGPKQIALYHNVVAYSDDTRFQYLTDTLPGSSGSPVFDDKWRVVALHHSGGWIVEPGTKKTVFRNEGININLIAEALNGF